MFCLSNLLCKSTSKRLFLWRNEIPAHEKNFLIKKNVTCGKRYKRFACYFAGMLKITKHLKMSNPTPKQIKRMQLKTT